MFGTGSFEYLVFLIITLLIAFTIHELAHAYSAYALGDHTAAAMGRLTVNPLAHLDPIGTLALVFMGFGWAKPVPVNVNRLKYGRFGNVLVSLAGPLSNFLLAAVGVLFYILIQIGVSSAATGYFATLSDFLAVFIQINVVLFLFNLLPIPPLDGYRIVESYMPISARQKVEKYYFYVFLVLLFCMIFDPARAVTFDPFFHFVVPAVMNFLQSFWMMFL